MMIGGSKMKPVLEQPREVFIPPSQKWLVWTHAQGEVPVFASSHWVNSDGDLMLGNPFFTTHTFARGSWVSVMPSGEPS